MIERIGNQDNDSHYEINSREIAAVIASLTNTIFEASLKRIHENAKSLPVTKVDLQRIEEKEKHRKKEEEKGDEES